MPITIKKLIEQLKMYPEDFTMDFGGLQFYRLKEYGETVHMEFNQTVYVKDGKVVVENHELIEPK